MDFSLDDIAKMDSLVIASTQQQQQQQASQDTGSQQHHLETNKTTVTIVANSVPSQTTNEDDPFGDIPDVDIDALVQANRQGDAPSSAPNQFFQSANNTATLAPVAKTETTPTSSVEQEDPFGDLPDFDIDAIIVKLAEESTTRAPTGCIAPAMMIPEKPIVIPNAAAQTRSTAADDDDEFPDDIDFDALDQAIAEQNTSLTLSSSHEMAAPPANAVVRNPRRLAPAISSDGRLFLTCSRYKVIRVVEDVSTFTKTLTLASWTPDMLQDEDKASRAIHHHSEQQRMHVLNRSWPAAGVVHLRGEWYHTRLADGDAVHIVSLTGQFRTDVLPLILHTCPPHGSDSDDLLLIVHPDLLLTPTAISETVSCTRRAILKNRLGSSGLTGKLLCSAFRDPLFVRWPLTC